MLLKVQKEEIQLDWEHNYYYKSLTILLFVSFFQNVNIYPQSTFGKGQFISLNMT